MAHFQLEVPHQRQQIAGALCGLFVQRLSTEDQHINIRERMQFGTAIAAHGDQRDRGHRIKAKEAPQATQQPIDKQRAGINQRLNGFTGIKCGSQMLLKLLQPRLQNVAGQLVVTPFGWRIDQTVFYLFRQTHAHATVLFFSQKKAGSSPA